MVKNYLIQEFHLEIHPGSELDFVSFPEICIYDTFRPIPPPIDYLDILYSFNYDTPTKH